MSAEAKTEGPRSYDNQRLFLETMGLGEIPNDPEGLPPSFKLMPWQFGHLALDVERAGRQHLLLTEEISWDAERSYLQYKGSGSQTRNSSPKPFIHYIAVNDVDHYFPSKDKIVNARNAYSAFIHIVASTRGATALVKSRKGMGNGFFWWLRNNYAFRDNESIRDVAEENGFGLYLAQTQGFEPDKSNPDYLLTPTNLFQGLVFNKL